MSKHLALTIIAIIAIAGILFSGYLSYKELFGTCTTGCSTVGKILNVPPCVFGFVMYTIVLIVSLLGLASAA